MTGDPSAAGGSLRPVAARDLVPGQVVELVGQEKLWDVSEKPWRLLGAGTRLAVVSVTRLGSGRPDRDPYDLTFTSSTGSSIALEVEHGDAVLHVVDPG